MAKRRNSLNQDHFKLGGTDPKAPDSISSAKQAVAREKARERQAAVAKPKPRRRPAAHEPPTVIDETERLPGVEVAARAAREGTAAARQAAEAAARKLEQAAVRVREAAASTVEAPVDRGDASLLGDVRALGAQIVEMGTGALRRRWEGLIGLARHRLGRPLHG